MESKKPSWSEIMDAWAKAENSYFLLECDKTGERKVYKGSQGLAEFMKWKRIYGKVAVRVTMLDKEAAKVLFGDEIQD